METLISLKYWRLQVSLVLRDVNSGATMGSFTDVQRSIKSLDCFGSSHFISSTEPWGHILNSTCYCFCLIKFIILYKTLTWKVCFVVMAGVGRWPASILFWATLDSGLRIKHFKIDVIWKSESIHTFRIMEKPLQTARIFCSLWLLTGWVKKTVESITNVFNTGPHFQWNRAITFFILWILYQDIDPKQTNPFTENILR